MSKAHLRIGMMVLLLALIGGATFSRAAGRQEAEAFPLIALATSDLAQRLGVSLDQVMVDAVQPCAFANANLIQPEPGWVDAPALTPGYEIQPRVDGARYTYHASGDRVMCVSERGGDDARPVVLAIADLAARLTIPAQEIAVVSVAATEFRDASLGVPQEGVMYAPVITPGYIIQLAVDAQVYTYHGSGRYVVAVPQDAAR